MVIDANDGSTWQCHEWEWQHVNGHLWSVNTPPDPEQFVAQFVDFWNNPSPERISEILHDDVVLLQPLAAPMIGIDAAKEEFRRIWRWLPTLRAQVDRWCGDGDLLFIEFRLCAQAGNEAIEWPNVDRFRLRGDRAIQRVNYFDPLAVLPSICRHPSMWWPWWRSGAARPWRTGHHITSYPRPGVPQRLSGGESAVFVGEDDPR